MSNVNLSEILDLMIEAALAAGKVILEIYDAPILSIKKIDGSPVTIADEKAEEIIIKKLAIIGLPILAEESVAIGNIPELGDMFFIVDPLDGTKEFIKKNGEFTVNIALIKNGKPICGIVTAPALNKAYIGSEAGAFKFIINNNELEQKTPIKVLGKGALDIVASRSHGNELLAKLEEKLEIGKNLSVGSSLKLCLVATGEARLYPRFTPTCEWDIAAGQAILEAAGGVVLTTDGNPLLYGKIKKNFYNPFFLAADNLELGKKVAIQMKNLNKTS